VSFWQSVPHLLVPAPACFSAGPAIVSAISYLLLPSVIGVHASWAASSLTVGNWVARWHGTPAKWLFHMPAIASGARPLYHVWYWHAIRMYYDKWEAIRWVNHIPPPRPETTPPTAIFSAPITTAKPSISSSTSA